MSENKIFDTSSWDEYTLYHTYCVHNGLQPLDKENYKADETILTKSIGGNLKFVVPGGVASVGGAALWNSLPEGVKSELSKATRSAIKAGKSRVTEKVISEIKNFNDKMSSSKGSNGGGDMNSGSSGSKSNAPIYARAYDLETKVTSLNTPVGNYSYLDNGELTNTGVTAMFMSGLKFRLPKTTDTDSLINSWISSILVPMFQELAQQAVGFNLNATTVFSQANIVGYFNAMLNALQIYYHYTAIIAYHDYNPDKNWAMTCLRNNIDADVINSLYNLKTRFKTLPIPPRMNNLCHWLMSNYSMSQNSYTTLFKFSPISFDNATTNYKFTTFGNGSTVINNAISSLNTYAEITNMLSRVMPDWTDTDLKSPSALANYDEDWLTLWRNSPLYVTNTTGTGTSVYGPSVATYNDQVTYSSNSKSLDGSILGLMTYRNTTDNSFTPGLIEVVTSVSQVTNGFLTNRFSAGYDTTLGAPCFNDLNTTAQFVQAGFTSFRTANNVGTVIAQIPNNCMSVLGVTPNSTRQSSIEFVEYLFDLTSLEAKSYKNAKRQDTRITRRK